MFFNKRREQDEEDMTNWNEVDDEDDLVIYLSYYMQYLKNAHELSIFCDLFAEYKENAIAAEEELGFHDNKKTKKLKKIEEMMNYFLEQLSSEAQKQEAVLREHGINYKELASKIEEAKKAIKDLEL